MTHGPYDLRLVGALAERRLLEARRSRVARGRTPSTRGAPPETSGGRVAFPQPVPGAAGHN